MKELRLTDSSTIAEGNQLLESGYDEQLSEKFAVLPRKPADYHRSARGYDRAAIFCIEEERSLSSDWIVRFENQYFQLEPPRKTLPGRGQVLVQRYLDGSLHFRLGEKELAYTVLPARPQPAPKQRKRKPRRKEQRSWRNTCRRQIIPGAVCVLVRERRFRARDIVRRQRPGQAFSNRSSQSRLAESLTITLAAVQKPSLSAEASFS